MADQFFISLIKRQMDKKTGTVNNSAILRFLERPVARARERERERESACACHKFNLNLLPRLRASRREMLAREKERKGRKERKERRETRVRAAAILLLSLLLLRGAIKIFTLCPRGRNFLKARPGSDCHVGRPAICVNNPVKRYP